MTEQSRIEGRRRYRHQKKRVDYLAVRLRRMVKSVLNLEMDSNLNPLSTVLKRKDQHVLMVGAWVFIYGICLVLFGYQMYDRVSYYLTYPVAVDVFEIKKNTQTFPEMTICNLEIEGLFHLLDKHNLSCSYNPIKDILNKDIPYNTDEIWKRLRVVTSLISAKDVFRAQFVPLQYTEEPFPLGICPTFRSINATQKVDKEFDRFFEITFKRSTHPCSSTAYKQVYVHQPNDLPMLHKVFYFPSDANEEIILTKKKFFFVNRTGNPCLSSDDQRTCLENCFMEFIRQIKGDTCRLPCFPRQLYNNIGYCKTSDNAFNIWDLIQHYFHGQITTDCHCARKCEHTTLAERPTSTNANANNSTIILRYGGNSETVIKERLCYDFIQLLCDIGGNSGLWIGCSLLSIFQLAHGAFKYRKKEKKGQFADTDPLYKIVVKTFTSFKQHNHNHIQKAYSKEANRRIIILKIFVLCFCVSLLIMTSLNRVIYFFQYPLKTVLDISFNSTLATPNAILCPGNPRIIKLLQDAANQSKFSNLEMWDLLERPGVNLSYLWINPTLDNLPVVPFESTRKPFYEGECRDLNQGIPIVSPNTKTFFAFHYTTLPGTDYYIEIRIDDTGIPCSSTEENEDCINHCLNKKLISSIKCRLPYMLDADLPFCQSSSSARHSHQTFQNLFFVPARRNECNCLPQCRTRVLELRHLIQDKDCPHTGFGFGPSQSIVEIFMIQRSYPVVNLLCDVGGMMGSTLGLSILSIMETVLILLGKAFKQPKN